MIPIPKIALVGRPNVGKSTLFNRICGRRKAITDRRPGSTRDRNYAEASWQGAAFELIDTGGLLLQTEDPLLGPAAAQAQLAIDEADLVLFVVDGRAGLLPDDQAIAARLRRGGKKVIVVVNKIEGPEEGTEEFARLGFARMLAVSAEHGQGVGDLLDAALEELPRVAIVEDAAAPLRVAIVGRPNVGKSSLLNRLLGSERSVVSAIPGTTRDAVDSLLERGGKKFLFVDTAGIRRVRHLEENVDHVAVVQARRALERADVALVILDAVEGLREMDATIAGYVQEAGRPVILVVNKWDRAGELELSARSGRGLTAMLSAADRAHAASRTRIATGPLNRLLGRATAAHAPKAAKGSHAVKLLYATQIGVDPPTFILSINHPVDLHFSYKRYLENQLREEFDFRGTPIVLKVRGRRH